MSPSWLFHPLFIFQLEQLFVALTAGFTSPHSPLRYFGFTAVVLCTCLSIATFNTYIYSTGFASRTLAGATFTVPWVYFERLLMRRWSVADVDAVNVRPHVENEGREKDIAGKSQNGRNDKRLGKKEKSSIPSTFGERLAFGFKVSGSGRGVGTSWEVKNVPHFSATDPAYLPPWSTFLLQRSLLMVGCWVAHDFAIDAMLNLDPTMLIPSYVPFLSRIGSVSSSEIYARTVSTLAYWVAQYCIITFFHSLFAVLTVSLKPTELWLWRPCFGDFKQAYSVRKFWG